MRKGTLFLSAVLTTFMMAIMAGAVSAYQKMEKNWNISKSEVAAVSQPVGSEASGVSEMNAVTPEQAAALAAEAIGKTDLFSVETTQLDGKDVYLVTFSSGDLVYVSPEGEILLITSIPPVVVGGSSDDDSAGDQSSDSHDDDDDDEDEDEDEEDEEDEDTDEDEDDDIDDEEDD